MGLSGPPPTAVLFGFAASGLLRDSLAQKPQENPQKSLQSESNYQAREQIPFFGPLASLPCSLRNPHWHNFSPKLSRILRADWLRREVTPARLYFQAILVHFDLQAMLRAISLHVLQRHLQ
jgi:hypothetical protein